MKPAEQLLDGSRADVRALSRQASDRHVGHVEGATRVVATGLALAVLLSSGGASASTDAGDAPRVVSVRHALLVGDDGRTYSLDGGVWLSDPLAIARAQDLDRLAAENKALRSTPPAPPLAMTLAVLAALVIGATVGTLLPRP